MKKIMTYGALAFLLVGVAVQACSNHKEAESEKGIIEEMTHKTAKEMVDRARTPIEKARSAANQEGERLNDMDKSLKE
jgi:hypothetical protein